MIEILLIIYLIRIIGNKAEEKGYYSSPFKVMFIALWVIGEIIGAIIGKHMSQDFGVYLYALMGAAIGAITSFLIVYNMKDAEDAKQVERCTVLDDKLIVYNKTHESTGILTELVKGSSYISFTNNDFNRFYKVKLEDGRIGYILRDSKQ